MTSRLVAFFLFFSSMLLAQLPKTAFKEVQLRFDTLKLNYTDYRIADEYAFIMPTRLETEEVELRFYPDSLQAFKPLEIISGKHYEVTDSLLMIGDQFYRVRLLLKDINVGQSFSILVAFEEKGKRANYELLIYPYNIPKIAVAQESIELFNGEERTVEIVTPYPEYFSVNQDWVEGEHVDYWLQRDGGALQLLLKAKRTGDHQLEVPTELRFLRPVNGKLTTDGPPLKTTVNVKPTRLRFLNVDREHVFFDTESRSAGEIQLDYDPRLKLKSTYRVEDVTDGGGRLVAEIVPKSTLGNDKILCEVFSYSHHRITDGYLYIKDGSRTLAMTNFNVVNRPQIQEIMMMREGGDWTENLTVYPGETVEIRIRGNGLSISNFDFTPCKQQRDTVRLSDRIAFYTVTVPKDIDRKKVSVFFNDDITPYDLRIREYKRPAPLNFVKIDYGDGRRRITDDDMDKPIFYRETIQDITLVFDRSAIDKQDRFFGIQELEIEVRVLSQDNKLIDIQTIRNVVICPDSTSPRHTFYDGSDCERVSLSLNSHLVRKTFTLDAFDQVLIQVRHASGNGPSQRVHIYAERRYNFDLDFSFPAGLLAVDANELSVGNFIGVSAAIMAQFKFFSKRRFGQPSPFQIGAGFLALNAFNFAEDAERDLGLVVMASIVPVRRKSSFSLPIYIGGGYFFERQQFLFLFGPGLQIRF
ncbi:MAG: hypothetical protein LAT54_05135 [Cryomorphaceae bacterium]|nr:hypothetical protein [Cryomorphaceae bacterium]